MYVTAVLQKKKHQSLWAFTSATVKNFTKRVIQCNINIVSTNIIQRPH